MKTVKNEKTWGKTALLFVGFCLVLTLDGLYVHMTRNELFFTNEIESLFAVLVIFINLVGGAYCINIQLAPYLENQVGLQKVEGEIHGFDVVSTNSAILELNSELHVLDREQTASFSVRIEEMNQVMREYEKLNSEGKKKVREGIKDLMAVLTEDLQQALLAVNMEQIDLIERKVSRIQTKRM